MAHTGLLGEQGGQSFFGPEWLRRHVREISGRADFDCWLRPVGDILRHNSLTWFTKDGDVHRRFFTEDGKVIHPQDTGRLQMGEFGDYVIKALELLGVPRHVTKYIGYEYSPGMGHGTWKHYNEQGELLNVITSMDVDAFNLQPAVLDLLAYFVGRGVVNITATEERIDEALDVAMNPPIYDDVTSDPKLAADADRLAASMGKALRKVIEEALDSHGSIFTDDGDEVNMDPCDIEDTDGDLYTIHFDYRVDVFPVKVELQL